MSYEDSECGEEAKRQYLNKTEQKKATGRSQLVNTPDKSSSLVYPITPNDNGNHSFSDLKSGSGSSKKLKKQIEQF